jgi:hypothetical protein
MGAIKKYKLKRVISGGTNNSTKYWGKFQYQKKDGTREDVTLTKDFEVIKGNKPLDGKRIFEVTFQKFGYEYELIVDADNKVQQLFLEAIRLDPKVHSSGQLKTGHLYQLVDENYEAIQVALEIKKRANVTNMIYALTVDKLTELCYFVSAPIKGKSKEEIYGILLHPINGKIFSRSLRAEDNHVDMILSGNYGSDYEIKVSVNKAIVLGIIVQSNGAFYLGNGGAVLGTSVDSVYAFFKENKSVFTNGLLVELRSKDILPESIDFNKELGEVEADIKADSVGKPFLGEDGKLTDEKREELRARAKELKIQGFVNNFSDSVLIEKVARAEGLIAAKQNM